jgi:hypothetical protein
MCAAVASDILECDNSIKPLHLRAAQDASFVSSLKHCEAHAAVSYHFWHEGQTFMAAVSIQGLANLVQGADLNRLTRQEVAHENWFF